jgi:hypothetical protein
MIRVVMRQQYRAQLQLPRCQRLLDHRGITRIHNDSVPTIIVDHPDVVVGQRR